MFHSEVRAADEIHPSWCTCSDCSFERRRGLRLDLLAITLGVAAALIAVGLLLPGSF